MIKALRKANRKEPRNRVGSRELVRRSFDDWSERGWRIKKGEKAIARVDGGIPVFSSAQVERPEWHNKHSKYSGSHIYVNAREEEACEFAEDFGDDAYMLGADF